MSVVDEIGSICELHQNASNFQVFCDKKDMMKMFKEIGHLFYIITPEETTFSDVKSVPNYYRNVSKIYNLFLILLDTRGSQKCLFTIVCWKGFMLFIKICSTYATM